MKNLILAVFMLVSAYGVQAQVSQKQLTKQVIGTWHLVSVTFTSKDGVVSQPYGESPQGILIFTGDGEYSAAIMRVGRPKFASGDKSKGTPEENKAFTTGTNSHFGKYVLDAAKMTVTYKVASASFPNWESTDQTSNIILKDDLLISNTTSTTSGGKGEVVWKRSKK
ncbi:MAG: lipocalin-like domain-containing protein [Pyrinomonadaceae bacterium]